MTKDLFNNLPVNYNYSVKYFLFLEAKSKE